MTAEVSIGYCENTHDYTVAATEDYMQSEEFVDLLNDSIVSDMAWKVDADLDNDGFPVFDLSGEGDLRQAAPVGLTGVAPTKAVNDDGSITGTTEEMEYLDAVDTDWTKVSGNSITGLTPGIYKVRYTAKTGVKASPSTLVTVPAADVSYWTGNYATTAPDLNGMTYTIDNAAELAWVTHQVMFNNSFAGYTIKLGANIDLSGHYWIPIGTQMDEFNGTFDGNGKTISNLCIGSEFSPDSIQPYAGLFGYLSGGAVIRNVTLTDAAVYTAYPETHVGTLAGWAYYSQITSCSSAGIVSAGNSTDCGGLIGVSEKCTVTDCSSSCTVSVGNQYDYFPTAGGTDRSDRNQHVKRLLRNRRCLWRGACRCRWSGGIY